MSAQPIDDPWVNRIRGRDSQSVALCELREVLLRGLRRAFRNAGGGECFCEDVAQDSLIRILDRLDSFEGRSRFTSWAMSIAVRIGTSQIRKSMFKDVSLSSLGSDEDMKIEFEDTSADAPEDREDRRAVLAKLKELIASELTDLQRQATQALLNGMPVEEIAARSDSNRNAVYKLIHDARMQLKQKLQDAGYTATDVLAAIE